MPHFPPPPELPRKAGLFRRVPPAIFPAVLGLLGLVASWRHAVAAFGLPSAAVEMASGMVTLVFLFCLVAYGAKVTLRPGAAAEDLRTLPGRTGIAALFIGMMVTAGLLADLSATVARVMLAAGFAGLAAVALAVLPGRLRGEDPAGPATPALHLVFVGFILAPGPAVSLAMGVGALPWLIWYCTLAAAFITFLTIPPLLTGAGAPPLRPLQVIHLAPPGFIAAGATATGQPLLAWAALAWASAVAVLLVVRIRWLTAGDFSGFWSAFTFPVTAFASALLLAYVETGFVPFRAAGGVLLVALTLYVPVIAAKILKLWAGGTLAAKTNASTA